VLIVLEKMLYRNIVKGIYANHRLLNRSWHGLVRGLSECCGCCRVPIEGPLQYRGQEVVLEVDEIPSPENIQWENLDISGCNRALRTIIVVLIILLSLTLSSLLIGLVYILGKAETSVTCTDTIPTYEEATVPGATEKVIVCYCKAHITSLTNPLNSFCLPKLQLIIAGVAIQLGVAVVTVVMNQFYYLMVYLSIRFLRLRYKQNFFSMQTVAIFVSIFINAGLLPLLVSSNINGVILAKSAIFILDLFKLNTSNITYFTDFTREWYFSFVPYVITYVIIDMVNPLIRLALAQLQFCCLESKLQAMEGRTTQLELNLAALPYRFDLEMELGQVLALVYITLLYGSGIPPLYPFCLLNLLVRYWVNKWLILRYSKRILGITAGYIRVILKLLQPAAFISVLFAAWMYTGILPLRLLARYNWFVFPLNGYLYRFIFVSFLSLLALGVLVGLLVDFVFVSCCEDECHRAEDRDLDNEPSFGHLKLSMRRLNSYEMRRHPDYMDVGTEIDRLKKFKQ
jgi:hypothetical protein